MVGEGESDIVAVYDQVANEYANYSSMREHYLDSVDKYIISSLDDKKDWLDVGCGDGRRVNKIYSQSPTKSLTIVEPSNEMAKLCKQRYNLEVCKSKIEDLEQHNLGKYDVITALWNIFGHIELKHRLKAFKILCSHLKDDGCLIFDVNNRHNAKAYGKLSVFYRKIIDSIHFNPARGDTSYNWKIGNLSIPSYGHLFTPYEVEMYLDKVGLKIIENFAVDYETGLKSKDKTQGQLLYKVNKK